MGRRLIHCNTPRDPRLRIATAEEFAEANERLIAGIQLLTEFQGRSLRIHCHLLFGDLIQVTRYAAGELY